MKKRAEARFFYEYDFHKKSNQHYHFHYQTIKKKIELSLINSCKFKYSLYICISK